MTEPTETHLSLIQKLVALEEKIGKEAVVLWDEFEAFVEKKLDGPEQTSPNPTAATSTAVSSSGEAESAPKAAPVAGETETTTPAQPA